jgi:hypothetical protein
MGMFHKGSATAFTALLALAAIRAEPARAVAVVHTGTGTSINGVAVTCQAILTIDGDELTIVFSNISTDPSQSSSDLCTSYYFDIYDGDGVRPALVYKSATGDVWQAHRTTTDTLEAMDADLMAVDPGDKTWQFKNMDPGFAPFQGFGVGTVKNDTLSPNNFDNNIVGNFTYGLYAGDATTANLNNRLLVKDHITFVFNGVMGFDEDDIQMNFAMGLGGDPDSILIPEPTTIAPLLILGLFTLRRRRRS